MTTAGDSLRNAVVELLSADPAAVTARGADQWTRRRDV